VFEAERPIYCFSVLKVLKLTPSTLPSPHEVCTHFPTFPPTFRSATTEHGSFKLTCVFVSFAFFVRFVCVYRSFVFRFPFVCALFVCFVYRSFRSSVWLHERTKRNTNERYTNRTNERYTKRMHASPDHVTLINKQTPLAVSPGKYMHGRCEMSTLNFILINNYMTLWSHTPRALGQFDRENNWYTYLWLSIQNPNNFIKINSV
jgi:hypothetical protein